MERTIAAKNTLPIHKKAGLTRICCKRYLSKYCPSGVHTLHIKGTWSGRVPGGF